MRGGARMRLGRRPILCLCLCFCLCFCLCICPCLCPFLCWGFCGRREVGKSRAGRAFCVQS